MYVVTSMGAGRHNVYFDVSWQYEPGMTGPVVYHTASALMDTEESAARRKEAQEEADRLNAQKETGNE